MNPCIVIPVHRQKLRTAEIAALKQAEANGCSRRILLACPKTLDCTEYLRVVPTLEIARFDDAYFADFRNHQRLMISADFYRTFLPHSHVLIYHLDAWIFRDELDYWCQQPYDYIGAPWRSGFDNQGKPIFGLSGNGGFSLRNISACLETIERFDHRRHRTIQELVRELPMRRGFSKMKHLLSLPLKLAGYRNRLKDAYDRYEYTEDKFWATFAHVANPNFRVAPTSVAKHFAFEASPAELYQELGNKLPFGCHAWRYDQDFWCKQIGLPEDPDFIPHDANGKPIDDSSK